LIGAKNMLMLTLSIELNLISVRGRNEVDLNCFTMIAGRNTSIDGSVLLAHNEDNSGINNFVDLHKVPRINHKTGKRQIFLG
jgi:hypothetical protein